MDFDSLSLLDMRTLVNNWLLLQDACVVFIMVRILAREVRYDGWYAKEENRVVIGLAWVYFFTALTRLWGFVLLKAIAGRLNIVDIENKYQFALWFTVGITIGLAYLIRQLTRSNREWIVALVVTIVLVLAMTQI